MSKQEWPDVVGKDWKTNKMFSKAVQTPQEAESIIRQEYKNIMVQVLPENSMVTMDYREDRVRIFVDKDNKVVSTPRIG